MRQNREPENKALAKDLRDSGAAGTPTRSGGTAVGDLVEEPVKVMRLGRMILQLLEEVRSGPLDDAARVRLSQIHERSVKELQDSLPRELTEELHRIWVPSPGGSQASGEELRVGQAQLAGWLEGLVHNIQAAIAQQQALTRHLVPAIPGGVFPTNAVIIPGSVPSNDGLQHRIGRPQDTNTGTRAAGSDGPPGQYL